jgi:hypothetical protein
VIEDLALGRRDQPGEDAHDGRLAASGRTDQTDEFVALDGQVDVLQHAQGLAPVEGLLDALQFENDVVGRCRLGIHVCLTCPGNSG